MSWRNARCAGRVGEIRRAARAHRRLPHAGRRQRRQRAGRRKGGAEDRGQMAADVRFARRAPRNTPTRSPARSAKTCARRCRGYRRRRRWSRSRPTATFPRMSRRSLRLKCATRTRRACARSTSATSSRRGCGRWMPSAAPAAPDAAAAGAVPERETARPSTKRSRPRAQLDAWLQRIGAADLTCIDTETTSLDPMAARLVGISLSVEPLKACYIPLAHRYPGVPEQLDFDATLAALRPWLESPHHRKVGQHLKYDMHVFANHGLRLAGVAHDTLLESYVLEAHRNNDMDSLAERHLGRKTLTLHRGLRQGRQPAVLRRSGDRSGHRLRGRGRRGDAGAASTTVAADRTERATARGLRGHRTAGLTGAVPHGAHRRAD